MSLQSHVIPLNKLGIKDVDKVGGKNASLGEMICHLTQAGVKVPDGFATTADAFRAFLQQDGLAEKIYEQLDKLDVENVNELRKVGQKIRHWIVETPFQAEFIDAIHQSYESLCNGDPLCAVAVRSSATAEDLPEASFAGQQETFLNIRGLDNILSAMKEVFASLFNDRAIAYRVHHGFVHQDIALSAGVQKMVRSDLAASGVMFSMDTESGFTDVVFITSSYGLGEMVVQGAVNPDEFYVHKPTLAAKRPAIVRRNLGSKQLKMIYQEDTVIEGNHACVTKVEVEAEERTAFSLSDDEIQQLAEQAVIIEKHYNRPMDIEWAKDGIDGQLYIVQARPETVKSRIRSKIIERYHLLQRGSILVEGRSIGQRIGSGVARILRDPSEMDKLKPGDVLVADMTDPDWEPIMKRASAIVTNRGGRTCHAAIIARELGIPAVVGSHDATKQIKEGQMVTISCAEGDVGYVYEGQLPFEVKKIELDKMPALPFKVMMNVANPDRAFDFQSLPNAGIGLARLEFIISQMIGVHPNACLAFETLPAEVKAKIAHKMAGYSDPKSFYVKKLSEGIATLAAAFYPQKVIVRFSDFKSNEYANLVGGKTFEPLEENPMIGFRGASRYIAANFKPCFALECEAIRYVRDTMGLTNVEVMIPFVRTIAEGKQVLATMAENGLRRGENGLRVIMMCELPSNAILAEGFLEHFDGFSIGSNDLTQLTLGLDRDSGIIAGQFDERDEAVKYLMSKAIQACKKQGKYVGICGQGPSDHPDLAKWLVEKGIDSVSLNPDTVLETWLFLAGKQLETAAMEQPH
ncbi:phosphoenolpyruvate synthase [Candidatus Berkiella aquae]|uniref:Phosphoenolpyruvate synthase n=1 Tax=Candidatus Berkiella aquae TaxID=295108 RepID=A0A0Q9YIB6_9GAMM|nr:phosphoenolpyruvate synthase [Candidatus Berkiella aquae]MCS5711682.1 phosphoenolpyruvate synthase [Candidatus Berkiella aquae]